MHAHAPCCVCEQLQLKKSAHEVSTLPRMVALAEAVERALQLLIDTQRRLHAATLHAALHAASAASGEGASEADDVASVVAAATVGWQELRASSGTSSSGYGAGTRGSGAGGGGFGLAGGGAPPPAGRSAFDAPLETLSVRPDAVEGVPLVVHTLLSQLLYGRGASGAPLLHTEGLFRVPSEPDDCEALRRQLDAGAQAARSAAEDVLDAHVLATTLKMFFRRLPAPLLPSATYRRLVNLGQQQQGQQQGQQQQQQQPGQPGTADGSGTSASAEQCEALLAVTSSLPAPNLRSLHALVELLEHVSLAEAHNRMSASNLALVWSPTLGRTDSPAAEANGGLQIAADITSAAHAIATLIRHRSVCFPPLTTLGAAVDVSGDGAWAATASVVTTSAAHGAPAVPASDEPDANASPPFSRRASSEAACAATWWYSADGAQVGPVTGGELAALLSRGQVSLTTWVFEAGTADWQELSQAQARLPQLATL